MYRERPINWSYELLENGYPTLATLIPGGIPHSASTTLDWLCKHLGCCSYIPSAANLSSLFHLPVLSNPDVQAWMKDSFPVQLKLENALARDPISLKQIQNEIICQSLEQVWQQSTLQRDSITTLEQQVMELATILKCQTSQWTPAKAHSIRPNNITSSASM